MISPQHGMIHTKRLETDDEEKARIEREADKAKFEATLKTLSIEQFETYQQLNQMITALHDVGVDTSYFPERAEYILIDYAKIIRPIAKKKKV